MNNYAYLNKLFGTFNGDSVLMKALIFNNHNFHNRHGSELSHDIAKCNSYFNVQKLSLL